MSSDHSLDVPNTPCQECLPGSKALATMRETEASSLEVMVVRHRRLQYEAVGPVSAISTSQREAAYLVHSNEDAGVSRQCSSESQ